MLESKKVVTLDHRSSPMVEDHVELEGENLLGGPFIGATTSALEQGASSSEEMHPAHFHFEGVSLAAERLLEVSLEEPADHRLTFVGTSLKEEERGWLVHLLKSYRCSFANICTGPNICIRSLHGVV